MSTTTLRNAAVLIPLYRHADGHLRLIIIRRAEGGTHGGQLAFPGGAEEDGDKDMAATAVRETYEEIGLPPDNVTILDKFPPFVTFNNRYRVHPYLARIIPIQPWQPQTSEVAEVIEISLDYLAQPEAHTEEDWEFEQWDQQIRRISFYRIGPYPLWGMTYHILRPLLPRLWADEWDI